MITDYFNDLRNNGIKVFQEDTCWIDNFCRYVLKNKLISYDTLEKALKKTLYVVKKGQTTKDVIALLKKFKIDYTPIDENYKKSMAKWEKIFAALDKEE